MNEWLKIGIVNLIFAIVNYVLICVVESKMKWFINTPIAALNLWAAIDSFRRYFEQKRTP